MRAFEDIVVLSRIDRKFSICVREAVNSEFENPVRSIRIVSEIVNRIFQSIGNHSNVRKISTESVRDYQRRLQEAGIIPTHIHSTIDTIRKSLNKVSQEEYEDGTASHILDLFEAILRWLKRSYGDRIYDLLLGFSDVHQTEFPGIPGPKRAEKLKPVSPRPLPSTK